MHGTIQRHHIPILVQFVFVTTSQERAEEVDVRAIRKALNLRCSERFPEVRTWNRVVEAIKHVGKPLMDECMLHKTCHGYTCTSLQATRVLVATTIKRNGAAETSWCVSKSCNCSKCSALKVHSLACLRIFIERTNALLCDHFM